MDRIYWEKIAPGYNEEIFDVLKNDSKGVIVSAIKKVAGKNKTVIDIGCAIGKWLPVLSPVFKKVYAVDISAENLEIAKKLYPEFTNVEYGRIDMSSLKAKMPLCDIGICINAILTDSLKKKKCIFYKSKKVHKEKRSFDPRHSFS
jgi:2-polyprenyl-3-methyl-5-hydroxy-6-metoxy-1,4-benzoquinol methylase